MLHQRAEFKKGRFIDLQDIVSQFGIEDLSLQKLYANLFHERITKTPAAVELGSTRTDRAAENLRCNRCVDVHSDLRTTAGTAQYTELRNRNSARTTVQKRRKNR